MSKLRLLFIKEAQASYISHLDLLRTFQRAFPRTELDIKHSQGYHPHPIISIVLPLPVGQSSDCELLDFEVTQDTDGRGIAEKLNTGMPSGLRVLDCYPASRPVRDLAYLRADVTFEYDAGVPAGAAEALTALFTRPALVIQKRTKRKDLADVDIAPMIQEVYFLSGAHAVTGTSLLSMLFYHGVKRAVLCRRYPECARISSNGGMNTYNLGGNIHGSHQSTEREAAEGSPPDPGGRHRSRPREGQGRRP